jgi:hypothetical protein
VFVSILAFIAHETRQKKMGIEGAMKSLPCAVKVHLFISSYANWALCLDLPQITGL